MRIDEFKRTLDGERPPADVSRALQALWLVEKGDWDGAHQLLQEETSAAGSWVHAYLHRVEGDKSNAGYWYRRADKPHATSSLGEEWHAIATALLDAD